MVALFGVICLWLAPLLTYWFLPETIPQNFHVDGSFRGESARSAIWLLPMVGLMFFALIRFGEWRRGRQPKPPYESDVANQHHQLTSQKVSLFCLAWLEWTLFSVTLIYIAVAFEWLEQSRYVMPLALTTLFVGLVVHLPEKFRAPR